MTGNLLKRIGAPLAAAVVLCATPAIGQQTVSASAKLVPATTTVGQPVQLQITIAGSGDSRPPALPAVAGLQFRYSGQQRRYELRDFQATASSVHAFQVIPEREGNFTIPEIVIEIEGKTVRTNAVTLTVGASPVRPASPPGGTATRPGNPGNPGATTNAQPNRLYYAELILPKTTAYVGEVIPAEVRYYFNNQARFQPTQPPVISGDGFTSLKFTDPAQDQQQINGDVYTIVTYRTAISGVTPGKIKVGPVSQRVIMAVPTRRQAPNAINDPFFDQFFSGQFNTVMDQREENITAPLVELEIKEIPTANRPASFDGAVGQFAMSSKVDLKQVKAGEPVTVTSQITGRGNFERVTAPKYAVDPGWKEYPATAQFKGADEIGMNGTKTFEQVFVSKSKQSRIPAAEFSYFDPVAGKYVTLKTPPAAVEVIGELPPTPAPAPVAAATPGAKATPPPAANSADILYLKDEPGQWVTGTSPFYLRPVFWAAQSVPLMLLLAVGFMTRRSTSRVSVRKAASALLAEREKCLKVVRSSDSTIADSCAAAIRFLQISAAIKTGGGARPDSFECASILDSAKLDEETSETISDIFQTHETLVYSGPGGEGSRPTKANFRREILDALQAYAKA